MNGAAKNGHLAIVQYLHMHREEGCTVFAMHHAVLRNDKAMVEFLQLHRKEGCLSLTFVRAAQLGYEK
jgi:hypothetical protein